MKDSLNLELLRELCHDLRTPLGAVGNWVHVLNSGKADETTRARALAAIASDVRDLTALIEQLSTLSNTLSIRPGFSLSAIDLIPFVKSAMASSSRTLVEFRDGPDAPALAVLADSVRLRQIVDLFSSDDLSKPKGGVRYLSVSRQDQTATLSLETSGAPRPMAMALGRALAEIQGGGFSESMADGKTVLKVILPIVADPPSA